MARAQVSGDLQLKEACSPVVSFNGRQNKEEQEGLSLQEVALSGGRGFRQVQWEGEEEEWAGKEARESGNG